MLAVVLLLLHVWLLFTSRLSLIIDIQIGRLLIARAPLLLVHPVWCLRLILDLLLIVLSGLLISTGVVI